MKKIPVLILLLLTLPSYAGTVLGSLNQHQGGLGGPGAAGSVSTSKPEVKPSSSSTSSGSQACMEDDQTSLPLAYVSSLIQAKDAQLNVIHDQRKGKLSITSEDMISNCSSMLSWTLKKPEIEGVKAYAIEVKLKEGEDCSPNGCKYKVARVENGQFIKYETMVLKPTLKGFDECLQKSGVIVDDKVVPGAIYSSQVNEKFDGVDESGNLFFLSHGPSSSLIKAKYGKFEHVQACDFYEAAHPQIRSLLTYEDAEKNRLDAEANKLKGCKADEYSKLSDFIEKYENYSIELSEVRDRLILQAAEKSSSAMTSGKYTDEDLKVLSDFDRYVVQPKAELARSLYEQMLDLEGEAKLAKQAELTSVLAQISALGKKPYFLSAHTMKLVQDGRFDDAEKLNSMKLVIENHQRLGAKQENVLITPSVAAQRIAKGKATFSQTLEKEKEKYEYRTGQSTGKAQYYSNLSQRMKNNIQTRSKNFTEEIQTEYQRIQQPNGYCYRYWRNTQKCIQESLDRIKELQAVLEHYNKVDEERSGEYEIQAKEYSELEAQGRRYVATQNGETPSNDPVSVPAPEDTTVVPRSNRPIEDSGTYSFNYNQSSPVPGQMNPQAYQQQASMTPQQYQNPMNPYQNNNMFMQQSPYGNYQQTYLGQQSFGTQNYNPYGNQGPYNFNWGGGGAQNPYGGFQQPGQGNGYWNQPSQAYGGYSMYGSTW